MFLVIEIGWHKSSTSSSKPRMQPDLVLADLQMPKLSGLDARRRLINEGICGAIISLTIHSDVKLAKLALKHRNTGVRPQNERWR